MHALRIYIPPLLVTVKGIMENISFMCFESSHFHNIKKWQSTIYKKFESFSNKYLFLSKYFAANEKEKLFPNDFSFISNLINIKTNAILTIEI